MVRPTGSAQVGQAIGFCRLLGWAAGPRNSMKDSGSAGGLAAGDLPGFPERAGFSARLPARQWDRPRGACQETTISNPGEGRGARTRACRVETLLDTCWRAGNRRRHECRRGTHECVRHVRMVRCFLTSPNGDGPSYRPRAVNRRRSGAPSSGLPRLRAWRPDCTGAADRKGGKKPSPEWSATPATSRASW